MSLGAYAMWHLALRRCRYVSNAVSWSGRDHAGQGTGEVSLAPPYRLRSDKEGGTVFSQPYWHKT